jgi:DHA1 family multidrug resistance protein-like MFS transporter
MAGPVFFLFLFFLPETQPTTILLHRDARLRSLTSNPHIRTRTEIDRAGTIFIAILVDSVVKPMEIMFKDPAITFVNAYTALQYGVYYSFFEVFLIVYPHEYGFNVGQRSLVLLTIVVGTAVALVVHFSFLKWYLVPDILERGMREQEHRLVPAIFASVPPVVGLFVFGDLCC